METRDGYRTTIEAACTALHHARDLLWAPMQNLWQHDQFQPLTVHSPAALALKSTFSSRSEDATPYRIAVVRDEAGAAEHLIDLLDDREEHVIELRTRPRAPA